MPSSIVQIGKRQWLVGMTWSSFADAPSKAELADDAALLKASWVSVRVGESAIQAGFCRPVEDVKSPAKLFSLAAMMADSQQEPWLGIYKIAEGVWWYIAVRDGHAILPDGDVIGGEEEIFAARERHSGYGDWTYYQGDLDELSAFIDRIDAKPTRVKSLVGPSIPVGAIATGAALVVASIAGGGYWWHLSKQAEEQERIAAMARMRAQMANVPVQQVTTSPLLTIPATNDFLAACNRAISILPLSKSGWALDQVGCTADGVYVHWLGKEGANVSGKPDGIISVQGDAVDQTIPLAGLAMHGVDDSIGLGKAKLAARAWAQAAGFALLMNEAAPTPVLPGASAPAGPPIAPQASLAMDIAVSPFSLDFSVLPGLRLTKIQSTENGWHVEGMIYGR